ncbi:phenylacetic acid degradation protein PaaB [Natronomonas salina]|uniref:phenylacetic acid degradation protein PaaB n=1 Tax=Natronomonas salina TaxID=1710540 RepID=UPI0015B6967E|nr:phenylacetic acid degradation protein PaaB [Natronomonas salina]QLD87705.1 phenylacetic acid degradation protein PaaB [Natronomonas salina]
MKWEVFRQAKKKDYHTHVGDVHAPNAELARQYAQIMHARRKPANSLWVVPRDDIEEVHADEQGVAMGGTTQKEYRWATNYNTDETFAEEIEASQREQEEAERDLAGVDE